MGQLWPAALGVSDKACVRMCAVLAVRMCAVLASMKAACGHLCNVALLTVMAVLRN
jgi:hypothetical protein